MPDELFKEIRMGMVKLILATDMAKHKDILDELCSYIPKFDFKKKEHLDSVIIDKTPKLNLYLKFLF